MTPNFTVHSVVLHRIKQPLVALYKIAVVLTRVLDYPILPNVVSRVSI